MRNFSIILAAIYRDHKAELIAACTKIMEGGILCGLEAHATLLAIKMGKEEGFSAIILEVDAPKVIEPINCSSVVPNWSTAAIIADILLLFLPMR